MTKSFKYALLLMLLFLTIWSTVARAAYDTYRMDVGEERTFQVPYSVTSTAISTYHWSNNSPSAVEVVYSSFYSITVKVLKYQYSKALLQLDYYRSSDSRRETYDLNIDIRKPIVTISASPKGGNVKKGQKVGLESNHSDAQIYYTLDGYTPSTSSTKYNGFYGGITIQKSCTLKAFATWGGVNSDILTVDYTVEEEKDTDPEPMPNPTPTPIPNGSIEINATNFPDDNFRNYLLEQDYGKDGVLTSDEISSITKIDLHLKKIKTFKGIEFFTSLTELDCSLNKLTSLDVSNNTALTELDCSSNQLTSLDVSNNTALTRLWCSNNLLTSLDVSRNTALIYLSCYSNQLTSLDFSMNTALTGLDCSDNQLTSLDFSMNKGLETIFCFGNCIKESDMDRLVSSLPNNTTSNEHKIFIVDIIGGTNSDNVCTKNQVATMTAKGWTVLDWGEGKEYAGSDPTGINSGSIEINATNFPDENFRNYLLEQDYGKDGVITSDEISSITKIDLSSKNVNTLKGIECFTSLTYLSCSSNQLTSLDVSENTALTELWCGSNQLTSLDVSSNTALTMLICPSNQLTSLDVSDNAALTKLICYSNQLTSLNVSENTALTNLDCSSNQLTSLDVSENTALTELWCGNNQLTSLDVSENTALTNLDCGNNQLTSLDVSENTALTKLWCGPNQLTSLDVSENTTLTELWCYYNKLTSLDVSRNTALTGLWCGNNQLTSLDVSENTALTKLICDSNLLTSLDVSKNTALTNLHCSPNQLTSLDVTKNTALTNLDCSSNQLTSLDVSNNTALIVLWCYSNQLSSLDVSNNTALTELWCGANQLTSLDISWNKEIEYISCYGNFIKEADMDNLINSLPNNTTGQVHEIRIVDGTSNEGNVCTKNQVAAMISKGWTVLDWEGKEYAGSDPTGINGILIDLEKDASIFDLSGKLLTKPRKGINIIGGKKVVIK